MKDMLVRESDGDGCAGEEMNDMLVRESDGDGCAGKR